MPRVTTKTKSSRGADYNCGRCGKKIAVGTRFFSWSFRYGGDRRQCEKCGPPRASQLTQSKLSGVYGAVEAAKDSLAGAGDALDIAQVLNDAAQAVDDVRQEYQDSLDNMPDGLRDAAENGETGEKMQALEEFKDALENAASDIEGEEFELDPSSEEAEDKQKEEWLEELRQRASDALGELSL